MSTKRRVSRREFLEVLGAGGTVLLLGWFAAEGSLMSLLFKNRKSDNSGSGSGSSTAPLAYAQSTSSIRIKT